MESRKGPERACLCSDVRTVACYMPFLLVCRAVGGRACVDARIK